MMFTGLRRGLEMMADYLNWLFWAISGNHDDAIVDLLVIARTWFFELTGAKIEVRKYNVQSVLISIVFGRDPFAGSQALFREMQTKYTRE